MKLKDIALLPFAFIIFYWATLQIWSFEAPLSAFVPANLPTRMGPSRIAQAGLFALFPLFLICVGIVWILEHLP